MAEDWARYWRADSVPVEAMHAHFTSHVYHRHSHESYSFGVTETGAQAFTCRHGRHVSGSGMVMAFNPDDPHDGHAAGEDGSGNTYLELFRQPVVVYAADAGTLTQAHQRALDRAVPMAIYTMDMFTTGNDDDNRAVVRPVPADELNFAGLAVHGPRNAVDKIFKGASLHP